MTKRHVDIDDAALRAAQRRLGTTTIKDTVNRALRASGGEQQALARKRLDVLAGAYLVPREDAWRSRT
jgi:Arc/MetJ family transcription regulator